MPTHVVGKRIPVIDEKTGKKEIIMINEGKTPNIAQITIAAKHKLLVHDGDGDPYLPFVPGGQTVDIYHQGLAARVFVYGIPKSNGLDSKTDCILLENKALNLPSAGHAGESMVTVMDVQFDSNNYIGITIELEVMPMKLATQYGLNDAIYTGMNANLQTVSYLKNGYKVWVGWNYANQVEAGTNIN
jgi:hypothetical protein